MTDTRPDPLAAAAPGRWTYPSAPYDEAPVAVRPATVPQGQPYSKGRSTSAASRSRARTRSVARNGLQRRVGRLRQRRDARGNVAIGASTDLYGYLLGCVCLLSIPLAMVREPSMATTVGLPGGSALGLVATVGTWLLGIALAYADTRNLARRGVKHVWAWAVVPFGGTFLYLVVRGFKQAGFGPFLIYVGASTLAGLVTLTIAAQSVVGPDGEIPGLDSILDGPDAASTAPVAPGPDLLP